MEYCRTFLQDVKHTVNNITRCNVNKIEQQLRKTILKAVHSKIGIKRLVTVTKSGLQTKSGSSLMKETQSEEQNKETQKGYMEGSTGQSERKQDVVNN